MKKKLVILHLDGLSYNNLQEALYKGYMPRVSKLLENDYSVRAYRSGIPSTTPYAQAGILYGDNNNIPSFTWFDKVSGVVVRFGGLSSFKKVAHKYFKGDIPLTKNGASIAACYPAEATETFALAYDEPNTHINNSNRRHVLLRWISNPLYILDWIRFTIFVVSKYTLLLLHIRLTGGKIAYKYFLAEVLQEVFLHHLTRYATAEAIKYKYPVIYAAFYAYDDAAHAFGPKAPVCFGMLRQLDKTISYIVKRAEKNKYELVLLSDHGQIETQPFNQRQKKSFGQILSAWLPTYDIDEYPGGHITPVKTSQDGEIVLTYSGGLAHMYFKSLQGKARYEQIEELVPGVIKKILGLPEIAFIVVKKNGKYVLMTKRKNFTFSSQSNQLKAYLKKFDDPEIVVKQLKRLASFKTAGDIILFGSFINGRQVNFENQVGGHGGIGGEQMQPFLITKKNWRAGQHNLHDSRDIYKLIKNQLNS